MDHQLPILITSSSFSASSVGQDFIKNVSCELHLGPLNSKALIKILNSSKFEGIIAGDDHYDEEVANYCSNSGIKWIAKYGTGLDSFNLSALKKKGIQISNSPGINGQSVAEHAFTFFCMYSKNISLILNNNLSNIWARPVTKKFEEITIGILGLGHVGQQISHLLSILKIKHSIYDKFRNNNENCTFEELLNNEVLFICIPLFAENYHLINSEKMANAKTRCIINTSRADIIDIDYLQDFLSKPYNYVYTDVWYEEPVSNWSLINKFPNLTLTPHVASRTIANIEAQSKETIKNVHELRKSL